MAYLLMALFLWSMPAVAAKEHGDLKRDTTVSRAFQKQHPCPSTGKTSGSCPGHVKDHVIPLCAGGTDSPSNLQWQTIEQAKIKDREERKLCMERRYKHVADNQR